MVEDLFPNYVLWYYNLVGFGKIECRLFVTVQGKLEGLAVKQVMLDFAAIPNQC